MIAEKMAKYPIKIIAQTPIQAYTPGQIINIKIDVNNDTDKSIIKFSVELIRVRIRNLKSYFLLKMF